MNGLLAVALAATLIGAPATITETTPTSVFFTTTAYAAGTPTEWVVPEGVTTVLITASAGNGGTSGTRPGGLGAVVMTSLPVTEGQVLTIVLGADGLPDGTGGAGYGAGGTGIKSAGGGGSSAILLDGEPAIVVGAGGGSGASTRDGGGGNGGIPAPTVGARNSGSIGANGEGGVGKAPWGGPGGAGFAGSGGDVGSDSGAGGGAGWGGGGAGGSLGDGAGGGTFPVDLDPTAYSLRSDVEPDGSVSLDFDLPVIEPTPEPTTEPVVDEPQTLFGINTTLVGIGAASLFVLGLLAIVISSVVRNSRGTTNIKKAPKSTKSSKSSKPEDSPENPKTEDRG